MQQAEGRFRMRPQQPDDAINAVEDDELQEDTTPSIRELQRRRRDAARTRADIEALIAVPMDDDDDEDEQAGDAPADGTPATAPARVYVVFHGAKWADPDGDLRESDAIAGVYATEAAASRAAAQLRQETPDGQDAWYQPYVVQSE
jgi:hypothetical protein